MKIVRADGTQVLSIEDGNALIWALQGEFEREDALYRRACEARTAALNKLNVAQKAFDAAVANLRRLAPSGSDWKPS